MRGLKLLRDDLRRSDVDKRPRGHRHHHGICQLPCDLRDSDADGQPYDSRKSFAAEGRASTPLIAGARWIYSSTIVLLSVAGLCTSG